jgi:outer membrane protein insertion porin family
VGLHQTGYFLTPIRGDFLFRHTRSLSVAATTLSLFLADASYAQQGGTIKEISVQGNQRVEAETVRSYLVLAEGDPFDDIKIDKSLKALFATGLFADVSIRREGDNLAVRVVENPIINRVAFENNHHVKTDQLEKEVQLKARAVYTRTKVQSDVKRILDLYRHNGRFAATVEPKLIELPQNRVDLVFEINEGEGTYVEQIGFLNNKTFEDTELKDVIQTREEKWWRFLSSDDTYDPDRVNYDRELLRRFYMKNGYADFRVVSSVAELSPDRTKFFLTFTLDEGERYRVGKVVIKSALKDLKPEDLAFAAKDVEEGDWYNADQIEDIVQKLTDAVGNKGYAFTDIRPQLTRDRANRVIDVTFDIKEAPHVFVERIDIEGNVATLDKVIRREFRLVEGDAFNAARLRRSKERIKDLDYFDKSDVTNVASDTSPDRTVIKATVTEKSTGQVSFGLGYSTTIGALIDVGLSQRNLLGTGQAASINASLAIKQTNITLGYTEPYFLDRHVAAGFDLFHSATSTIQTLVYDANTTGGDIRFGYAYDEYLSQLWKYTASVTNITNIQEGASIYIQEEAGTHALSSIGQTLLYDRRDSRIQTTSGYYLRLGTEYAGLGGDQYFIRTNIGAGQFFKLSHDGNWVLSLTASLSDIEPVGGKSILINQRFFLGGDTMRGFKVAGISPRDYVTQDALGGLWQAIGSAELKVPLGLPKEFGVQGLLFTDVGTVGQTDKSVSALATTQNFNGQTSFVQQSSAPRVSAGAGVIWKSPMGPINIDIGMPIVRQSYDKIQIFRLNFGQRF